MFKDGFPILRIAQRLNQSGVPTPMEHKRQQGVRFQTAFRRRDVPQWEYNTIARILKNEVYLGNLTQGKRGTPNHKVHDIRLKDEADWIHAEATHEALISPDDFMVVSELLKRDMRAADDSGQHYLFSGFLYCGDCKQGMVRKTVTRCGKSIFIMSAENIGKKRTALPILSVRTDCGKLYSMQSMTRLKPLCTWIRCLCLSNVFLWKKEIFQL